jgi:hypothetical protein
VASGRTTISFTSTSFGWAGVAWTIGLSLLRSAIAKIGYAGIAFGALIKCSRCVFRNDSLPLSLVLPDQIWPVAEPITIFCPLLIAC